MGWFTDWIGYKSLGPFYGLHVSARRKRQADYHRQREAALRGRIAELEGRPVIYVHGRPYEDPDRQTD